MSTTTLGELAAAYAESRDVESLARLRSAILSSATYRPDLDVAADTAAFREDGHHQAVVELICSRMPGAFFSPAAHSLLSQAYAGTGDQRRADQERRTARLALQAILGSGDGTRAHPWQVLRISDEYDALRAQKRTSRRQQLVSRQGRSLDRHECDDGTEAWFDVSDVPGTGSSRATSRARG